MPSFTDTLTVNGESMEMYASIPSGPGPHPAVVIAFHVGGVDEFDKVMADRFAEEGYVAVVPDLFHRFTDEQLNGPRLERLNYLSDPDIIADMNAAVDFLNGTVRRGQRAHRRHRLLHGRPGHLAHGRRQPHLQMRRPFLRRQHYVALGRRG